MSPSFNFTARRRNLGKAFAQNDSLVPPASERGAGLLRVGGALTCALAAALLLCAAPLEAETLRIVVGGDVVFGRETARGWRAVGGAEGGGEHAFDDTAAALLREADLAVVNLETPICEALPPLPDPPPPPFVRFRAPLAAAGWLAAAGVDVVSLANNHALDCGPEGLRGTLAALRDAGVTPVGAAFERDPSEPVVVRVGRVDVVLLAATDHRNRGTARVRPRHPVAWSSRERLREVLPERVARARAAHPDAPIIVLLHWGVEGATAPTRDQVALGHALVEAGATLVAGHGAHVPHGAATWRGGAIIWGAGNLVFDMTRPRAARERRLYDVTLRRADRGGRGDRAESGPWRAADIRLHELPTK